MNFQEQLQQIIQGIFSQNNQSRKQGEDRLAQLREAQPNEFVMQMLNLCRHEELKIRQFAPVYLRYSLSKFAPKSHKNVWNQLISETKETVKLHLFQFIEVEMSHIVRNQLCDTIGEIGGSLYEDDSHNEWHNLLPTLWQMFLSPNNDIIECGFKILGNLFMYSIDQFDKHYQDLHTLFVQGLASPQIKIKSSTMHALGNYVKYALPAQYKIFQDLISNMMKSALDITIQDQSLGEGIMEVFSNIVDSKPKFLRKQFNIFFNGIYCMFRESQIDNGVKRIGTETLLSMVEKFPGLFKFEKIYLMQVVEMIFYHMIQISSTITDEWMKPPEGFNDDIEQDEDCETTRFGMSSIDRLIESLGRKEMLPLLNPIVSELLRHQDWRCKHAAIMALSQVGEYIDQVTDIKSTIELILPMLNDSNSMIRYAVCHAIGQIADDMKPKFQESYLHIVVPQFLNRLTLEDVPRVNSHILAALTNFVEGTEKGIEAYLPNLIQLSIKFLNIGISIEKENAISVIAATAESSKLFFIPYVNELLPLLFQIFSTHQTKQYRQLKGQAIETITLIASAVGEQVFLPFLQQTVQILIQVQTSNLEAIDPQKSYVLSGWQRLALVCPQQLAKYLGEIVPSLFKLIQQVFNINTTESNKKKELLTYDNEEAEVAIHMLSVFIEELKQSFFPFVEKCIELIVPLSQFNSDETIRSAACKCLVSLVKVVKETNNSQQLMNGAKYFLGIILEAAFKESDPSVIIEQIDCIKQIIDIVSSPFMTTEEVSELSDKLFKLLLESDKRRAQNENLAKEEDVDEDEKNAIKEQTETEENLHGKIAECIGSLFESHKELVLPLSEVICNQILQKVLDQPKFVKMHQFGLSLLDYIVEYFGFPYIQKHFIDFAQVLTIYAVDPICSVRQAAVYGIGVMATNTPQELYLQVSQSLIKAVVDSLKAQKNEDENEKQFGLARDHSISALGKILKSQPQSLGQDLVWGFETWLYLLPLQYDKRQAHFQHNLLAEFIIQKGGYFVNGKSENAFHILKVLANCYKSKWSTISLDSQIVNALRVFEQLDSVKVFLQQIFLKLSPEDQKKLLEIPK
ncbi:unnamed protein product (macronuclear) [Paramecium tetraurelia]|uniref:TOG domain-containing protein n=1 Tax=Paramecium tetraurelia TaxID=5888 RepID=A0CES7_PARTE|nr:uncharacterized protein GSPATT00037733001 [Paramecium tetraurelia]CAK69294.1 unnamed protein product [Paramecium tetraurelia]|eukprot:XP_001436691.1 hypothetical protein (macronuclear) [Paramecium tetraurelia strain d4-2]